MSGPTGANFFMRPGWNGGRHRDVRRDKKKEKHVAEREQRPEVGEIKLVSCGIKTGWTKERSAEILNWGPAFLCEL